MVGIIRVTGVHRCTNADIFVHVPYFSLTVAANDRADYAGDEKEENDFDPDDVDFVTIDS
jgi:hypothetical protein